MADLRFRPLFVCGSPKSGTTWLQKILDAHPAIACAGEGHFVERIVAPMVRMLRDYNAKLGQVDERVYQGKAPYQPLEEGEVVALVRQMVTHLMLRQKPAAGVTWLGDKTPRYTEGLRQLRLLFPGARIVHIIRDPRDVAVSRLFHAHRAGMTDALSVGSEAYYTQVRNAATAWAQNNDNVDRFCASSPGHAAMLHEVRYEALLADFAGTVRSIFAFLGVDAEAGTIAAIARLTDFETLSGRKPGEEDGGSFFRKGIVGDWLNRLDTRALEILDEEAGALMRSKGYQAPR